MENVNLRLVRAQLPKGSISLIAKELGIPPTIVGGALTGKRDKHHRNAVVEVALKIIKDQRGLDVDIIKEAKELDLTSGHYATIPYQHKKNVGQFGRRSVKKISIWYYVVGAAVLIAVFRKRILSFMDKQTA
jgi:hypothetical protein